MAASENFAFSIEKLKKRNAIQKPRLYNKKDDQSFLNENIINCYIQN